MPDVYVSVGSNVERDRHIPAVLNEMASLFGPLTVSSVYESEAVGFVGDPFYNLVVGFLSERSVEEIAHCLTELERRHGRTRDSQKFAPRTLDLDLLLYGDAVLQVGKLQLPRAEITEYAFMLEPLAEIAPDRVHPRLGKRFAELWAAYDKRQAKQRRITPPWAQRRT